LKKDNTGGVKFAEESGDKFGVKSTLNQT